MENKPFYKSKTIWGLTLSGILPVLTTLLGIDLSLIHI